MKRGSVIVQARLVDAIKRHAVGLSIDSPRGEAWMLSAYLWSEECAEGVALARTVAASGPDWLGKLIERQLDDEGRHAALLRARLIELGHPPAPAPAQSNVFARAKLWLLDRVCVEMTPRFAAGPVVPLLAAAALLERTGVRVFGRHLGVLQARARDDHPTAAVLRAILADERRHMKSCEAALDRLVEDHERPALALLRARIGGIDRALGVTSSLAMWAIVAGHRAADRMASR